MNLLHDRTVTLLDAHQLARSTCKSFLAPSFTLLIVPYNSVYYNYITIMQWLVGSGIKANRGVASAKKCTVAPCFEEYLCAFMKFEYTRLQLYTVVQVGGGIDPATDISQFRLN